jgi:hypothetical protein
MKGYLGHVTAVIQNYIKSQGNLLGEICQEVLTLHLLTITLRRNSNPPGFFCFYEFINKQIHLLLNVLEGRAAR